MSELWIIIIGITIFDLFLFGGLGLFIWKSDKIYLKDEGRWIPGFNLPRLYSEPGDILDHDGFKKHIGITLINFGILFTLFLIAFVYIMDKELLSEIASIGIFMLLIFGLVLFLTYTMFTRSEKFIERVASKRIRYDIYLFRMIIGITLVNIVPYFFGVENILLLIFVSMLLTFVIAGYYIYRIYQLLKENKKDFL